MISVLVYLVVATDRCVYACIAAPGPLSSGPEVAADLAVESYAHLVLEQWLRRCAPVTHQDQGFPAFRQLAPGCVCSPRKPSVPQCVQASRPVAVGLGRTDLWLRRVAIQPLVARAAGATNSCNVGGIGTRRAIRSYGFSNPKATLPWPSHRSLCSLSKRL